MKWIHLVMQLGDKATDTTRTQIMRAACREFADKAYSSVSLDDILTNAEVTKGAMYFHFRSKHALAEAIIDERTCMTRGSIREIMGRKLSGLETIVDIVYLVAAQDYTTEVGRAGLNLMDSVGRIEGVQAKRLDEWVKGMATAVARAVNEGDIAEGRDPEDVARLIISMYTGTRLTTELNNAEQFLRNMETNWKLILPGFAAPDRIDYFSQFIARRTVHALKNWRTHNDGPSS
ncbi:TetR/AcrR family transcriptional regulator [Mycobacterium sp. NBC_00419]|uniref:TetR/AcrR family transcriptional regulator n=1 Tax=Mycobacterium sp. NBC_00419 TaxID=2975989 RepID=UPI002E1D2763